MKVAVYGTLKRGGRLHGNMKAIDAKFIEATTIEGFKMYHLGGYPAVTPEKDKSISIEVFEIDDAGLARLDRVEGYPGLYQRKMTDKGWIYFMEKKDYLTGRPVIEDGNWKVKG